MGVGDEVLSSFQDLKQEMASWIDPAAPLPLYTVAAQLIDVADAASDHLLATDRLALDPMDQGIRDIEVDKAAVLANALTALRNTLKSTEGSTDAV